MPDIETLMQEWPAEMEELLKEVSLPTADLDCDLTTYVDLICGELCARQWREFDLSLSWFSQFCLFLLQACSTFRCTTAGSNRCTCSSRFTRSSKIRSIFGTWRTTTDWTTRSKYTASAAAVVAGRSLGALTALGCDVFLLCYPPVSNKTDFLQAVGLCY